MKACTIILVLCAAAIGHASVVPAGLFDEAAVDRLLEVEVDTLPFHFKVPIDLDGEDFENMEFISLSEGVRAPEAGGEAAGGEAGEKEEAKDEDEPIVCETICRPMNEKEGLAAGNATRAPVPTEDETVQTVGDDAADLRKGAAAAEAQNAARVAERNQAVNAGTAAAAQANVFLEVQKHICVGKGGNWDTDGKTCEPFMRTTSEKIVFDAEGFFDQCQSEYGKLYIPCSPYQALALAHLYEVEDHSHFWLWPGGRHDQVESAAFKQDIGNNPVEGLDKCPEGKHVGFFHNWDEAHVDSWGCLSDSQAMAVLCCRRG